MNLGRRSAGGTPVFCRRGFLLFCLLASVFAGLVGSAGSAFAEGAMVLNAEKNGYRVVAKNGVFVRSPKGKESRISDVFYGPNLDWNPTGPIQCAWSPDGSYVAVAVPHPRVTELFVFDTQRMAALSAKSAPLAEYPEWFYENIHRTATVLADSWNSPTSLRVKTEVTFRGKGEKRTLPCILRVNGQSFSVHPDKGMAK